MSASEKLKALERPLNVERVLKALPQIVMVVVEAEAAVDNRGKPEMRDYYLGKTLAALVDLEEALG